MSEVRKCSNDSGGSGCETCSQLSQLEIEAFSAIREISPFVKSLSLSEVLSRTSDLLFLNMTTFEGKFANV